MKKFRKLTNPVEISEKSKEYVGRLHFWTNHSIAQLSFSIDFFVALGMAFLAFLMSQQDANLLLDLKLRSCMFFAILLVGISVVFGCLSVWSRLKDLRVTRSIVQARKSAMKKGGYLLPGAPIEGQAGLCESISALLCKCEVIRITDDKDGEVVEKFNKLRSQSATLGKITWCTHKTQIICFLLSVVAWIASLF